MSELLPKIIVPFAPGTNCDQDTIDAIELVGGDAEWVHVNELTSGKSIEHAQGIIIPGGFSFGDDLGSGNVFSQILVNQLGDIVQEAVDQEMPVTGICNGFQVLVRSGLLPDAKLGQQTASLTTNKSNKFEHRWVKMAFQENHDCTWLQNIPEEDRIISLPSAHKEGRFVGSESTIQEIEENNQVVLRYCDEFGEPTMEYPLNPNGSTLAIAGIAKKMIFGLMPHPERFVIPQQAENRHRFASPDEIRPYGRVILGAMVDFIKES